MTISEMHVWFRQYAQQMGMQNVRAILPEQIDTLINTSIKDTIDEVVRANVGTTNDRVITDNAKLASVNALRTLYKVKTIAASGYVTDYKNEPYTFKSTDIEANDTPLYYVDFAVRYQVGTGDDIVTRWFPIRIIDDSYLADVLNDWVLAPRMRTPVMVIYKDTDSGAGVEDSIFELYFGENDASGISDVANRATIKNIRCSYIKKPNKVQYLTDIGGTNVNSDLPEQLQIPMLKHAVDLYRASIQGSLFASQQQAQEQQRENVRNNARPDNEGYQS